MKIKPVYIFLVLLLAGAATAYWMYARRPPDVVHMTPQFNLSAGAFTSVFEQNAAAAGNRFDGKIIRVSGIIKSISGSGAVVLANEENASEVVIGLDQRHKDDISKVRTGTHAVFQGVYSGYEQNAGGTDDLLSGLGTTVQLRSAGLKEE